jgi:tRNA A37 methylthiotransferase MiaB|tara:strand:- start:3749 stop:4189 length:441 start_codon:yes stop_codon:yes gene_type:complete
MRNVLPFGILMIVGLLLLGCGAGSESAETATNAANEDACACLAEMKASLEGILAEEHAEWTAKQWTESLTKATAPCMRKERTPEELSAWSQAQAGCEDYAAYKALVTTFRGKLAAAVQDSKNMPQDIKELTSDGAKGLLDQLSKQR